MSAEQTDSPAPAPSDFIRDIVAGHVAEGLYPQIVTRFPPEPNGYLHIGHAKSICLNFGLALENNGRCNLRFDDTNPAKEDVEYVDSITTDVRWLINGWADQCLGLQPRGAAATAEVNYFAAPAAAGATETQAFFASNYFDALYACAEELIRLGHAYVCDLTPADTEAYRGSPEQPGRNSPFRDRSVDENLDLFRRMRAGEFPDATRSLRAKIDMTSPNMWLRDPLIYRIRHVAHHQTGNKWCIYPLYDFAHCLSDYFEGITHSVCTLEFESHRPLYDWVLASLGLTRPVPHQYEFAKLHLGYTIVSKRKLLQLVNEKLVTSWDDPRMPTISGLRRRGIPASALRRFVTGLGVTKYDSLTDLAVFEHTVRDELNQSSERRLGVLRPIKLVLTNIAEGETIACTATNTPQAEVPATRTVNLTREVYIDSDDFAEVPPPKYFRLKPDGEVRLKYACIIKFEELVKDDAGNIVEIRCFADLNTRTGHPDSARKVKGTIHWVSATESIPAEVRLYDRLFTKDDPDEGGDFLQNVNPDSLEVVTARLEPALADLPAGTVVQFERLGYFTPDAKDHSAARPVFNRAITLKDAWVPKR